MRLMLTAATLAIGLLTASTAVALKSGSGQVVAVDRERQLVQLHDGTVYYLPNRVFVSDFRRRPRATLWYREENGRRVVVHYTTEFFNFFD